MVEATKRVYQLHNGAVADGTLVVVGFRGCPMREYVVQYRESDLAFISRLLEHERHLLPLRTP